MRRWSLTFLAVALAALSVVAPQARAGVLLSELCDPNANYQNDRFIEIWNSGPGAVDLTNWRVIAIANGVNVCTWNLSGTLAAGQAKVCGTTTATVTIHFQNAAWGTMPVYMNWNGKVGDGAKLIRADSVMIDSVVASGTLFENADLVRQPSIVNPNSTYTPSEWIIPAPPVQNASNASPGTHNGSAPPPSGPIIANIATIPASPTANTPVYISATAVDTSGPIDSVYVAWGLSSGSLPNVINMSLESDSTYHSDGGIPGQTAGVSIYYRISAKGPTQTGQTLVYSYTIPGTSGAPTVLAVGELSDSTFLVTFSEPVQEVSAEVPSAYTIGALVADEATWDPAHTAEVTIKVRNVPPGARTLSVTGVQDLDNNPTSGATRSFTYIDVTIPSGYYASTTGLTGTPLKAALHNIIKNHTVKSYAYALEAFGITDIKPNGKIWDMYSDIPGGTPPYEYAFGQTGQGATEGLGYNREHSFPQSWFGGSSPMYSDLWILYPTDAKVNGYRSSYAYGMVATPSTTSLNGSKLGTSASANYSGTVFEPINAYKGDLARGTMYVSTRYYTEDGGWGSNPESDGAVLKSWSATQYTTWSIQDPVSWKERLRNGAVYTIQGNRNPFVDHPEWAAEIFDPSQIPAGVEGAESGLQFSLRQNVPNPMRGGTVIRFDLAAARNVSLRVYDVAGRQLRTLVDGARAAGRNEVSWDGTDDAGRRVGAGIYFYRVQSGGVSLNRKLMIVE